MCYGGGRDEYSGARGEFDGAACFPQHEVAAALGIKGAQCGDPAPAKGEVGRVGMLEAGGRWPEVKSSGGPYAVLERAMGVLIRVQEGLEVLRVIPIKLWGPVCEGS